MSEETKSVLREIFYKINARLEELDNQMEELVPLLSIVNGEMINPDTWHEYKCKKEHWDGLKEAFDMVYIKLKTTGK